MGGNSVAGARHRLADAHVPTFDTVNQAVEAFMHMVRYRRSQDMLMQTPPSKPAEFNVNRDDVRLKVAEMLRRGQPIVTGRDAKSLLAAFGMRTIEARTARSADDAASIAERIGFPVSLKILCKDGPASSTPAIIEPHLQSPEAVKAAARRLTDTTLKRLPRAVIEGFTVERMIRGPQARELRVSVADDAIFGPVIVFGHGGPAADVISDRAVALPPLNMSLARELIETDAGVPAAAKLRFRARRRHQCGVSGPRPGVPDDHRYPGDRCA